MRSLFTDLYEFLTAPLYRKVYRDISMQLQQINSINIDNHERTTRKIVDELLSLNLLIEQHIPQGAIEPSSDFVKGLSNSEIDEIIKDIDDSVGAVEICQKHKLPMKVVLELKGNFSGMSTGAIRRARELEKACESLCQKVDLLAKENRERTDTPGNASVSPASTKQ
jgi:hypothetical protein